jgi:secreted trypsin-like serine protease
MRAIRTASLTLAAAATLFAACSSEVVVKERAAGFDQPILNGDPASRPEHQAVVSLHQRTKRGKKIDYVSENIFCSGTLIASDVVLTAGHCLEQTKPTEVAVYVGDDPTVDIADHVYMVDQVLVHPSYDSYALTDDIALLRLARDVTEAAPVPHLPASLALGAADVGGILNFAGFGQTENGTYDLRLQVDGTLEGFGCGHASCYDGGDAATQIWYNQDAANNGGNETGPCFGDSGGPAFAYRGAGTYEEPYVAGITSYGDSNCTEYGVSTRVDAYQGFIDDFIAGGGGSGGSGGGGGGCSLGHKGDSCTSNADCCSNKCSGKPGSETCK